MKSKWKRLVKTVAPAIATVLGTPLAGLGVRALSEAILGTPDGREKDLEKALKAPDGDTLLRMKEADNKFKLEMEEKGIDYERIAAEDRASARLRQVELKDKTPDILAYILTLGFFGVIVALFKWSIPGGNEKVIYTMVGSLGTVWIAAMAYFHGSSRSSARKDAVIAQGGR